MENTYACSYVEVLEILKHIPKREYEKIPKEKIEFYENLQEEFIEYSVKKNFGLEIIQEPILTIELGPESNCYNNSKNNKISSSAKKNVKKSSSSRIGFLLFIVKRWKSLKTIMGFC